MVTSGKLGIEHSYEEGPTLISPRTLETPIDQEFETLGLLLITGREVFLHERIKSMDDFG